METSQLKIPIELSEALEKGNVILFLGRGLAEELTNVGGVPSDREMAEELASRCNYSDPDRSLPSVANFYERVQGRHALLTYLKDQIEKATIPYLSIHELIACLPVKAIITTMYDDSLEQALKAKKRPYDRIFKNIDLLFQGPNKLSLIYLCGRYDLPDTMRVTKKDLNDLLKARYIKELLSNYIRTATLVFVGFSIGEGFFVDFYDSAIGAIDEPKRLSYMFTTDAKIVEAFWGDEKKVAPIEALAHDGLLALYNDWLDRRTRPPAPPNFDVKNRQFCGKVRPKSKCLSPYGDDVLEARFAAVFQASRENYPIPEYFAPVSKRSLTLLTLDILESSFTLFDLRHNSIEPWVLLGAAIALDRECSALVQEGQAWILDWVKSIRYTSEIDNLEHELDLWWKERGTSRSCDPSIMPKWGTCVLIDLAKDDKEAFAKHARASFPHLNVFGDCDDQLTVDGLRDEFHAADLVILRTEAVLSPQVGIVIGMALGAGASIILATEADELSREFVSGDAPYLLKIHPTPEAILSDEVSEFGKNVIKYPLLNQVLEQVDRLIKEDKLETAWAICERLSHVLPNLAAIYERRAQIYKACGQSDHFRHQLLLASDLNPSSSAVKLYQHHEIEMVEQALQNQEIAKSLSMIKSLLQQGMFDSEQRDRLEDLLLQVTEIAQETKNPEALGAIKSIVDNHGSLLQKLTSKLEEVTKSIIAIASRLSPKSKESTEEKAPERISFGDDEYWEKLEQLLASFHARDLPGIRLLTDQRAHLQVELQDAQRQLQDVPRLRQQVRNYSNRVQELEATTAEMTGEISEMTSEISEVRNALEKSEQRAQQLTEDRNSLSTEKTKLAHEVDSLTRTLRVIVVFGALAIAGLLLALTLTADELRWWGFVVACLPLLLGLIWWWRNRPFSVRGSNSRYLRPRPSPDSPDSKSIPHQQSSRPKPPSRR